MKIIIFLNILKIVNAINGLIWVKSENDFLPIFNISTFLKVKQNYFQVIRELEVHNFENEALKLGVFYVSIYRINFNFISIGFINFFLFLRTRIA